MVLCFVKSKGSKIRLGDRYDPKVPETGGLAPLLRVKLLPTVNGHECSPNTGPNLTPMNQRQGF
jgi:hypothetical protein